MTYKENAFPSTKIGNSPLVIPLTPAKISITEPVISLIWPNPLMATEPLLPILTIVLRRKLDLPHDWAVEQGFSEKASFSHGFKNIGRQFPEASIGWYRKKNQHPKRRFGT